MVIYFSGSSSGFCYEGHHCPQFLPTFWILSRGHVNPGFPNPGCSEEALLDGGDGALRHRPPPTDTLMLISSLSKATREELSPAGCTEMERGYRTKNKNEVVTREMSTARDTNNFLWESKTQVRGLKT